MFSNVKVLEAKGQHSATMIFLHGMGEKAEDWINEFSDILPAHIKLVCPQAPIIKFTAENTEIAGWFDMVGMGLLECEQLDIEQPCEDLRKLIDSEVSDEIPSDRIILGGFSQGAALALYTTFKYGKKLGTLFTLSGYMVCRLKLIKIAEANPDSHSTPYIAYHGTEDQRVAYVWGQCTFDIFKKYLNPTFFKSIPGLGHATTKKELKAVCSFVNKYVAVRKSTS